MARKSRTLETLDTVMAVGIIGIVAYFGWKLISAASSAAEQEQSAADQLVAQETNADMGGTDFGTGVATGIVSDVENALGIGTAVPGW